MSRRQAAGGGENPCTYKVCTFVCDMLCARVVWVWFWGGFCLGEASALNQSALNLNPKSALRFALCACIGRALRLLSTDMAL